MYEVRVYWRLPQESYVAGRGSTSSRTGRRGESLREQQWHQSRQQSPPLQVEDGSETFVAAAGSTSGIDPSSALMLDNYDHKHLDSVSVGWLWRATSLIGTSKGHLRLLHGSVWQCFGERHCQYLAVKCGRSTSVAPQAGCISTSRMLGSVQCSSFHSAPSFCSHL